MANASLLDILEEALEDFALYCAIEEGEQSPMVSCGEVFEILEHASYPGEPS